VRGLGWLIGGMKAMGRDGYRLWPVYALLGAIWILATVRVLADPTPRIPLLFNWTPSLPYRVAWLERSPGHLARGDLVVYAFQGEAISAYPGLARQPFFKRIAGVPGDRIEVAERTVFVAGQCVGFAKRHTFDGHQLSPIGESEIPPGHYYMRGTSPDSFDSRYGEAGLVAAEAVIGRVHPWF
jgi:conjugal transfer pilin signal peptidase TrbI